MKDSPKRVLSEDESEDGGLREAVDVVSTSGTRGAEVNEERNYR